MKKPTRGRFTPSAGASGASLARSEIPHRQRVLLMFEPGKGLDVGQIVAASTLSRSAVSHDLRVLREAGALRSEKVGKEVYFRPDVEAVPSTFSAVQDYRAAQH